jgi:hypothetical protein
VTASWQGLQTAPRDGREVWLFLPGAKFTSDADGAVSDVKHAAVAAVTTKPAARGLRAPAATSTRRCGAMPTLMA